MLFYFSSKSVPELAALTDAKRKEIWHQVLRDGRSHAWWTWLIIIALMVAVPAIAKLELPLSADRYWRAAIVGISYLAIVKISTHFRISKLLPEIRERVGGLCLSCGCDIQASPDRCPKCG